MAARQLRTWPAGPADPRLAPGELEVWRADLRTASDEVLACLSVAERRRSARFPRTPDGELWARSRGVLRALLGSYQHVDPATIALAVEGNGKPTLTTPQRRAHLSFNVSHSGPLALYAFSRAGEVGVDVQTVPRRPIDHAAIAGRLFGSREGRRFSELVPEECEREFLRLWARHEAVLKCRGTGLGSGPGRRADARVSGAPDDAAAAGPWVAELKIGIGAAAAVALADDPRALRCWSWSAIGDASDGADDAASAV
jgi:4'-phosphopantetheinyl transferase